MKRLAIILLALCLCLSGCGGKPKKGAGSTAGGWTPNPDGGTDFPEEAAESFRDAMADYPGVGYVPMAYLGSQVVAGTNYAFLCRNTTLSVEPVTTLTAVVVYRNLGGSSSILRFRDVSFTAFSSDYTPETGDVVGGWRLNTEYVGTLPAEAQSAFEKAAPDTEETSYIPLALLGTQVVAGRNYAVLCTAVTRGEETRKELCILIIYEDPSGSASVSAVKGFEIP